LSEAKKDSTGALSHQLPEYSTTGSFELFSVESRPGVQIIFSPKVTIFHPTTKMLAARWEAVPL
jgi:hypothetical protein